jgi:hypothetical protein
MKCLQFDTLEAAQQRNTQEAIARGCTGDVTAQWWSMREQNNKFYLVVNDDALLEGEVAVDVEFIPQNEG